MTVEIRELVIKTTVGDLAPSGNATAVTAKADQQLVVKDCVAEVLKILKREKER